MIAAAAMAALLASGVNPIAAAAAAIALTAAATPTACAEATKQPHFCCSLSSVSSTSEPRLSARSLA
jgi:hypothetical protein